MTIRFFTLILLFLLLASIGYIYWQHVQLERLQENRYFDYEYRPFSSSVVTRWKRDGKIESIGFDRNEDLEIDSLIMYGRDQRIVTIWVDDDFNGIYEMQYIYSPDEVFTASYHDKGQDGYFEHYYRYTRDSVIVYRDDNEDGWYEESEIIRREASDQ